MSDINVQLQEGLNITQDTDEINVELTSDLNIETATDTIDITTEDAQPINITLQEVLLRETETGTSTFLELTDTPDSYATQAGKLVAVKQDETGLEYVAPNPGDITGVTAGTGLSGGGTSGDVTLSLDTAYTDTLYSPLVHNHDDRYYTEAEIDAFSYLDETDGDMLYLRKDQNLADLADWSVAINSLKLDSAVNGQGASLIAIENAGGLFASTHVEGALNELMNAVTSIDLSVYLVKANNLSDLTDVATARTNLGLVAGGVGDIWVEKAGDTMTGQLFVDGSSNQIQSRVQGNGTQTVDIQTWEISTGAVKAGVDSTGRLYGDPSVGTGNTVFGKSAYRDAATGTDNTIFGNSVGTAITSGARNVLIGQQVGQSINTGAENVMVGEAVGQNVTDGGGNFGLGRSSLANITVGDDNVAIGTEAMRLTSGDSNRNIAIGRNALGNSSTVFNDSVGIGRFAGRANAGTGNTYIGTQAGMNQGTGTNNVMIGYTTGQGASAYNASGNVFIGYAAGQNETASNRLYIENSTSSSPLIYGEFDNDYVKVNGRFDQTAVTTGSGAIFSTISTYTGGSTVFANISMIQAPASAASSAYTGGFFQAKTGSASTTIAGLTGGQFNALNQAAGGTVAAMTGGVFGINLGSAGNVTNGWGLRIASSATSTGAVLGEYRHLNVESISGSGMGATRYGLYIGDVSGGATANWSIVTNAGNGVFNEGGGDWDYRIEGDTATHLLVTDAGLDAVQIGTTTAGVIADFRSTVIVFNEDGADRDVRFESDTDANNFFSDAGANRIGIGTATPNNKLEVVGTAQVDGLRIDITPVAETPTATHTAVINLNGTDYRFLCLV